MTELNCPSVVRVGRPEDFDEVWRLFNQAHDENKLFEKNSERGRWWINRALASHLIPPDDTGPRGIIGVIGPKVGGHLEGVVFLTVGQFWYTDTKHLEEFLVYVDKDHRRSHHARAILKWMEKQVEETGLPLLTGIISNVRTQAKCNLYRKLLPKAGEFFFLSPKGSNFPQFAIAKSSAW